MPSTNASASPKVKERKLDEAGSDNMAEALEQIEAVQNEIDDLNEKASEEILTVEQKYNKLRRPHFLKRNEITVNIPNFWAQAITNHPMMSSLVNKEDEECLKSLTKVDVEEFADIKSGYKLVFTFKENEFFTNTELVKEFHLSGSGETQSESTSIKWKEGKNLSQKSKGKKSNGADLKRPAFQYGFFDWFAEDSDPSNDEYAEHIKDDIWPNPLHYYLASDLDYSGLEKTEDFSDEDEDESLGEEPSDDCEDDIEGEDDDDPEEDEEDLEED